MAINKAEKYAQDVRKDKIIVCNYVRLVVERYYNDLDNANEIGIYFDKKAATRAINFIEKLVHTKGEWAGNKFILEPWQAFIVWNIFGWKKANGQRRYNYAYIEVARKNGKTLLSSGIALYMLMADGENRAEVYSVATTQKQASICLEDAKAIVRKSDLKNYLKTYRYSVTHELSGSNFIALSSESNTHDGYSPHCAVIDEFHAHQDSEMFDVIKSGIGARTQPLMFIITTAGKDRTAPCYSYRDNVIKILQGVNVDDSVFGIIFTQDKEDDWDKKELLIKSNPNVNISISENYLLQQICDAKNRPESTRNVKTKNCNLWVDSDAVWILDEKWQANISTTNIELLNGMSCWGGLDLSNNSDITAYVLLFNCGEKYQILPFFWIPKEKVIEKIKKENINYDDWIAKGYVRVTDGNIVDYDIIQADILKINDKYNVRSVAYDRWSSTQIVNNLKNEGVKLTPFGQGYKSMSMPTKELERYVLSELVEHYNNPVMRWMISNSVAISDPAGNVKIDKSKTKQKIDGVIATIMAIGEMLTFSTDDFSSIYSGERGLLE